MDNLNALKIIADFCFELGRTYENRYIQFGLYDTIDIKDFQHAANCGAAMPILNNSDNLLKLFPRLTERQANALNELHVQKKEIVDMVHGCING